MACVLGLAFALVVAIAGGGRGVGAIAVTLAVFALWRLACLRRLGRHDWLQLRGALTELVEVAVLLAFAWHT